MNNWKDIHPDFTDELIGKWASNFTFEETRDWINIGLKLEDAEFASYLKNQGCSAENVLNYGKIETLKEDYINSINELQYFSNEFNEIEKRITKNLLKFDQDSEVKTRWGKQGFEPEKAREWIKVGLKLNEEDFADYVTRIEGYTYLPGIPRDYLLVELRDKFSQYKKTEEYKTKKMFEMLIEKLLEKYETNLQFQESPSK